MQVGPPRQYRTVCVAELIEPIDSETPMALVPDKSFEDVSAPFAIKPPYIINAVLPPRLHKRRE